MRSTTTPSSARSGRFPRPLAAALLSAGLVASTAGCFVHRSGLDPAPAGPAAGAAGRLDARVAAARELQSQAVTREGVETAIAAWEEILETDPRNRNALVELARLELLFGAAYTDSCREREAAYRRTLHRAEAAMAGSPAFRTRIETGRPVWEAVDGLGVDDLDAMNLWSTALFYQYRDCLSSLGRVLNLRWIRRARAVLDRMQELDPDWESGALHIYYLALPEVAGGDRERSAAELAEAIELGPDWIVFRWGRGRYFHLETGDREGFAEDLEWVVAQDPRTAGGRPEWNVYFQREARELLAEIDRLFPQTAGSP